VAALRVAGRQPLKGLLSVVVTAPLKRCPDTNALIRIVAMAVETRCREAREQLERQPLKGLLSLVFTAPLKRCPDTNTIPMRAVAGDEKLDEAEEILAVEREFVVEAEFVVQGSL
jgi:hypothetical protein